MFLKRDNWLTVIIALVVLNPAVLLSGSAKEDEPGLRLTFMERLRQESWDNAISLDRQNPDSSSFIRLKSSLGLYWRPGPGLLLSFKTTNENRHYLQPKNRDFSLDEFFVEELNLRWERLLNSRITLTAGRQNLMFDEGFVVFDGGPLDGSRSAYFNALRLDYAAGENSSLTTFYCHQPEEEKFLPLLNRRQPGQKMVEQPETGYGLYYRGFLKTVSFQAYALRKNVRPWNSLTERSGINLFGGRFRAPLNKKLSLTAEAALQTGYLKPEQDAPDLKRAAAGAYAYLDWKAGGSLPWPAGLTLGSFYLSGDQASTGDKYEGWDPFFARWPKWSESLIYLLIREHGGKPAFWTNMSSLYLQLYFQLSGQARLDFYFHRLGAPALTGTGPFLSGRGRHRGNLFIGKLTYDVNRSLSGHFLWESFAPGDFYHDWARPYAWVRFELLLRL